MKLLDIIKKDLFVFFKTDQIKKEELDKILEAGLWTPNARARRAVKLVIVLLGYPSKEVPAKPRKDDRII